MILKEILTEYRNGNKKAIEKIYNDDGIRIKILDKELNRTIRRTYNDYIKEGITNRKRVNAVFNGDINDMSEIFISELYSLFADENFEPFDETAMFKALKYNVVKRINQELQNEPITRGCNVTNDDDEDYEIIPESLIYDPFYDVPKSGYSGANKELLNIIKTVDIERLCRSNAETQINVANLIKKYYREVDGRYPTLDKMLCYFKYEYGYEITKDIYSRALNNLFSLICNNTTAYKGLNINRRDYISQYDSEGNVKPAVAPIINHYCLNSDNVISLINIANKLEGYAPKTVTEDKFYTIIKQDNIMQICFKYKRLAGLLENPNELSVEDYSDVLEAVCIMLNEYVQKYIEYQLNLFIHRFSDYKFDTCYDVIFNIAMGKSYGQDFWSLCQKKDGLHIVSFKQLENDMYKAFKGKADIRVDCNTIYQIGKCKFIISKKAVYCRSANKELINIRCVNNKYSACQLAA